MAVDTNIYVRAFPYNIGVSLAHNMETEETNECMKWPWKVTPRTNVEDSVAVTTHHPYSLVVLCSTYCHILHTFSSQ
jgi:hypothetical protein